MKSKIQRTFFFQMKVNYIRKLCFMNTKFTGTNVTSKLFSHNFILAMDFSIFNLQTLRKLMILTKNINFHYPIYTEKKSMK